jgi:hypothetical protein
MGQHSKHEPTLTEVPPVPVPTGKWPPMFRMLMEGDRRTLRLLRDRIAVYVDWTEWRLGYKLSPAFHRVSLLPLVIRVQRHRRTPSPVLRTVPEGKVRAA